MHSFISQAMNRLPVLGKEFNPLLAGLLGFLFVGIGLALYIRSWRDLLVSWLVGLVVLLLAALIWPDIYWLLSGIAIGVYGYLRVFNSNERLTSRYHKPRTA